MKKRKKNTISFKCCRRQLLSDKVRRRARKEREKAKAKEKAKESEISSAH
jgi:hypothetical protein